MLPYLAQGANSAIEDGAVLGLLLGHIRSKGQLPKALKMYERLRKARGDAIVKEAFKQVRCGLPKIIGRECKHTIRRLQLLRSANS